MRLSIFIIILFSLLSENSLRAQAGTNSLPEILDVYQQSKVYAFEEENYPKAIAYLSEESSLKPHDTELTLFLYKMHFWAKQYDLAIDKISDFLLKHPLNLDAHNLNIDIYESQGLYKTAIEKCKNALVQYPDNLLLTFRLAYSQSQADENEEANQNCNYVLAKDPENKKALNLSKILKQKLQKNFLVTEYRYFFLNTPEQALNFYNLQYGRKIKNTTLIGIVNMGKAFEDRGLQYNLEMYNKLGSKYYSYLHFGYSNSILFPELRINAAIYKSMSHRMEGSLFLTLIKNDLNVIRVLSPSLTKSFGNTALTATTNIINKTYDTELTYRASIRQYIGSDINYVGVAIGSFSRDENLAQRTEQDLVATYLSYQAQINLGYNITFGINYNRNISKDVYSRDQLSVHLKHNF